MWTGGFVKGGAASRGRLPCAGSWAEVRSTKLEEKGAASDGRREEQRGCGPIGSAKKTNQGTLSKQSIRGARFLLRPSPPLLFVQCSSKPSDIMASVPPLTLQCFQNFQDPAFQVSCRSGFHRRGQEYIEVGTRGMEEGGHEEDAVG